MIQKKVIKTSLKVDHSQQQNLQESKAVQTKKITKDTLRKFILQHSNQTKRILRKIISNNLKKKSSLKNPFQIKKKLLSKKLSDYKNKINQEQRNLNKTISVLNDIKKIDNKEDERKLLQIQSENLDYYDIYSIQEAFKNDENFVFKISNFNLEQPSFNINFLNDKEEKYLYDVKWDDSDFIPVEDFEKYSYFLDVVRQCLKDGQEKMDTIHQPFYQIIQDEMEGCPTAVMSFVEVVENFRKYLINIRQNSILNNFNIVKIEQYSDYFELSNDPQIDKLKINPYLFEDALNNSEGKGFNFDDYILYYRRSVQTLIDSIWKNTKQNNEIKFFFMMMRTEKLQALYCNFLAQIDEFKIMDRAITKWIKSQKPKNDQLNQVSGLNIINYEKNVWTKEEDNPQELEVNNSQNDMQKANKKKQKQNQKQKNNEDSGKNNNSQSENIKEDTINENQEQKTPEIKQQQQQTYKEKIGSDPDQTGLEIQKLLQLKVDLQNKIFQAELFGETEKINTLNEQLKKLNEYEKKIENKNQQNNSPNSDQSESKNISESKSNSQQKKINDFDNESDWNKHFEKESLKQPISSFISDIEKNINKSTSKLKRQNAIKIDENP